MTTKWYVHIEVTPFNKEEREAKIDTFFVESSTITTAIHKADIEFQTLNRGLDSRRWQVIGAGRVE